MGFFDWLKEKKPEASSQAPTDAPSRPQKAPACKICCACPMQRRERDECVLLRGMENCEKEIETFYKCLLEEGFTQQDVDSLRRNTRRM